jgi:hypothetical protein
MSCDCSLDNLLVHMSVTRLSPYRVRIPETNPIRHIIYVAGEAVVRPTEELGTEKPSAGVCHKEEGGNIVTEKTERDTSVVPIVGKWAEACFPAGSQTTERELRELLMEAAEAAKQDYDAGSAVEWAEGYTFPPEYMESDVRCLQAAQLNFPVMVRRRLKTLAPDRMNAERVSRLQPDNPELGLLKDLVIGMKVHLPKVFTTNGLLPRSPRRPIYETVATAVNKMLGGIVDQRLAFLLPLDMAQRHIPNLHLCKAHWTHKKGKKSGRPLGDLSNVDGIAINNDDTAAAAVEYYGKIRHPTISDIAVMIYEFWIEAKRMDPSLRWEDMRIWKMDLKGAYTLLSFRPEDVGLFAMLLTGDMVYLQLAGIFGWSGTPAAFQVVTRAICWELRHALHGRTLMYVDDIVGVCFVRDLQNDLDTTRAICTDLLGPNSVADDKTESGTRMDVIGYTIDLSVSADKARVLIARKNFLTALHGFISTDTSKRINLRHAQRLASWGTRYGMICRVMRPFCGALNRVTWGRTEQHALFLLSEEAIIAVQCWRAMLCLVRYRETEFTRTLESFTHSTPVIIAEFDASLSGAGLIWAVRRDGAEEVQGVSAVDFTSLGFGVDSSFQNLSEFIGAILAAIGQVVLGYGGSSLALRGDSVTALTWAITERPRGSIVTNAAMIWTLLCIATDINVREVTHIAGEENDKCDRLSRRGAKPTTTISEDAADMGMPGVRVVDMNGDDTIMGIVELCDPRIVLDSEPQFIEFWTNARLAIERFLAVHRPTRIDGQDE